MSMNTTSWTQNFEINYKTIQKTKTLLDHVLVHLTNICWPCMHAYSRRFSLTESKVTGTSAMKDSWC